MDFSIGTEKVFEISTEESEYIESLQFEVSGYKNLLEFMISGGTNIDSDNFKNYHKEYLEKNTEYELAKNSVAKLYLKEYVDNCSWNLDFATHKLTAKRVK